MIVYNDSVRAETSCSSRLISHSGDENGRKCAPNYYVLLNVSLNVLVSSGDTGARPDCTCRSCVSTVISGEAGYRFRLCLSVC